MKPVEATTCASNTQLIACPHTGRHGTDWTKDLDAQEARAALDALDVSNAPTITAREAVELVKLKRALEVKVARGTQAIARALNY
jgi:hypothetical protein